MFTLVFAAKGQGLRSLHVTKGSNHFPVISPQTAQVKKILKAATSFQHNPGPKSSHETPGRLLNGKPGPDFELDPSNQQTLHRMKISKERGFVQNLESPRLQQASQLRGAGQRKRSTQGSHPNKPDPSTPNHPQNFPKQLSAPQSCPNLSPKGGKARKPCFAQEAVI